MPGHGPLGARRGPAPRCGVGWRAPRRPLGGRAGGAPGPARQQQVGRGAGRRARRRRRAHRRRLLRRGGPPRRPARVVPTVPGPAQGPRPGDTRRRGAHPRVRAHRPGGLQVRLLRLLRRRRRGGGRPRAPARRRAGRGARPHREPGVRRLVLRAGGRGARRVLRSARPARAGRGRRARRALRQRRVGPDHGRVGGRHPGGLRQGAASTPPRGSRPSPGAPSWPPPA